MQVSDIARVCSAVSRGDFTHKIHAREESVVMVQLRDVINGMVDNVACFSNEILSNSVRQVVESSCHCSNHTTVSLEGAFLEGLDCTSQLAATFITVIRSVAHVAKALALGDYSKRLDLPEPMGELLDLQVTVNAAVQLLQERAQK